ncbi:MULTISPECIES: copper chaperone PCu(A)C [Streptomyces]|uniref:Copper chaperone PCu(A)C n=1 Tax=Streptomyces caniscabiei TaxID=2746961 RepID=A0A927QI13_9ACTN|nr:MULTISPECIES: copper chaperone PCu(A)C [Streptomyces]MBD9722487.1 copper chaperone PCu(A)C [Streptomyces caniscabiei]MDX3515157.1 copper chaperone PCu(A)C [Streptomyces caniscabiei]MDX3638214.1 copper chaperone PCu(A)C [Streptomyces sp. MB09-02B]MDX3716561.1 copper chaperone PCu(A)C [Streptomyces caniscabiei]WEO22452.1 copper chaperone PCu(A)C [Streptomyces caniscabiei]
MTGQRRWRPTRRRVTDSLITALAPVAACGVALGGLTTWVAQGNAGSPARITVTGGRVFLPFSSTRETSAFFRITNSGGADDRLLRVTSASDAGDATLSRHRMAGARAAYGQTVDSAAVPAGGSLAMSPFGTDVTVRAKETWREGDLVPFTLHFARSGRMKAIAVVVRPGMGGA